MTFAFLFLTNEEITHPDVLWHFVKTQNVYIHHKKIVQQRFQPYIIDSLVETKWAESSIVDATINLLEESYLTEENMWFVLLSLDAIHLLEKNPEKINWGREIQTGHQLDFNHH